MRGHPMSSMHKALRQHRWHIWLPMVLAWVMGSTCAGVRVDAITMPAQPHQAPVPAARAAVTENVAPVVIGLPALAAQKSGLLLDDGGARQIGVARDVGQTDSFVKTSALLNWQDRSDGRHVAAMQWMPDGAWGVRLGVVFAALPAETVIRLYPNPSAKAEVEITGVALLERLPMDAQMGTRTWWTPDIGTAPVLEFELPARVSPADLRFSVPRLSQIVVPAAQGREMEAALFAEKQLSNDCQQDVNCQESLLDQRNAVIRMAYVSDAKTYQCTGVLINNPAQDRIPYVLTAAHCAKDAATASTLQTAWFNYSQSCGSRALYAGHAERYGGARWLASSLSNDMTLLQLHDVPPEGAVFAGWDTRRVEVGARVLGIHHPRSDLQKINRGSLAEAANCSVDYAQHQLYCAPEVQPEGGFYRVALESGSIEPGSSGSALFLDGRVVGTLTGGRYQCSVAGPSAVYGRLDQAISSAFHPWLNGALVESSSTTVLPVYRFYIPQSAAYFYTISPAERDQVIQWLAGVLEYEGVFFSAATQASADRVAVHRFFNPGLVAHFYTASDAERQYVEAYFPQLHYEGIAWWAPAQPQSNTHAVYRFYRYSTSTHRYTTDEAERDMLQGDPDFSYEGLAYYVWAAP